MSINTHLVAFAFVQYLKHNCLDGRVLRNSENVVAKTALTSHQMSDDHMPKKQMNSVTENMQHVYVAPEGSFDQVKWRKACKQVNPAPMQDNHYGKEEFG